MHLEFSTLTVIGRSTRPTIPRNKGNEACSNTKYLNKLERNSSYFYVEDAVGKGLPPNEAGFITENMLVRKSLSSRYILIFLLTILFVILYI